MFGNQSQFKQQKYQQFEVRKTGYGQTWNTELKTACCADPGCKSSSRPQLVSLFLQQMPLLELTGCTVCRLPSIGMLVRRTVFDL